MSLGAELGVQQQQVSTAPDVVADLLNDATKAGHWQPSTPQGPTPANLKAQVQQVQDVSGVPAGQVQDAVPGSSLFSQAKTLVWVGLAVGGALLLRRPAPATKQAAPAPAPARPVSPMEQWMREQN